MLTLRLKCKTRGQNLNDFKNALILLDNAHTIIISMGLVRKLICTPPSAKVQ